MTEPALQRHAKSGLLMREGPAQVGDEYILGEARQYLALGPHAGDVLLDIGASIGSVTALMAPVIRKAVAFEPEPSNFEILTRNTEALPNVERWQAAVVHACAPGALATLYVAGGKNLGLHSLVPTRGRSELPVKAAQFSRVLDYVKPTLVKCDIEGGEYDLAEDLVSLPEYVRGLAIEYHLTRPAWRNDYAPRLISAVLASGFRTVRRPKITDSNWATMAVYLR